MAEEPAQSYCGQINEWNQSPINIRADQIIVEKDDFTNISPLELHCGNDSPVEIVYSGHDLSKSAEAVLGYPVKGNVTNVHIAIVQNFSDPVGTFTLKGGSSKIDSPDFRLESFHIHEPSEHTINGRYFPMELHMFHINYALKETVCKDKCSGESDEHECKSCISKDPNGVAVFAILFEIGPENSFIANLLNYMMDETTVEKMQNGEDLETVLDHDLYVSLAPHGRFYNFFYYEGSTTTPPCSYSHWYISQDIKTVTIDQIWYLKQSLTRTKNNRVIQDTNHRPVYTFVRPTNDYYSHAFDEGFALGGTNQCENVCQG